MSLLASSKLSSHKRMEERKVIVFWHLALAVIQIRLGNETTCTCDIYDVHTKATAF